MPNVSVIIPTYNRAQLIGRALDSVNKQSFPAYEVIVVDDGSEDNTLELIQQHYTSIKVITQQNKGVSAARNLGIKHAASEWIAFLDSDDEWLPDKLEKQCEAIQNHPHHYIFHTNEIWIRDGKQLHQMKKHKKHGGYIFNYCIPLCVISPSSILIHNSVFEHIGNFNEALPVCEDYDLWLRICAEYPVIYLECPLVKKYGGHKDQLSRKYWGMDRFRIQSLENILFNKKLDNEMRQAVINTMLDKINIYLEGADKHGTDENVKHFKSLSKKYALDKFEVEKA